MNISRAARIHLSKCLIGEDYVRFCTGRDFGDCALERGVLFGEANQSQNTITQVIEQ